MRSQRHQAFVIAREPIVMRASHQSRSPTLFADVPGDPLSLWDVSIMSSNEFRENAEECTDWARTARSDRERKIFLQMAEAWHTAAVLSEFRQQCMLAPSLCSLGAPEEVAGDGY
jgi:hypothetical protein